MYPVFALYHYYPETFWVRVAITLALVCVGIILIALIYKKGRLDRRGGITAFLWWLYTLFLMYITVIGRYTFDDYRSQLTPFESYRLYFDTGNVGELKGIILNIVIFIPFGILTAELFRNKRPVALALISSLFFTVSIEIAQYFTHTGTFETDDIIHNTVGAVFGVLIWVLFSALRRKNKNT